LEDAAYEATWLTHGKKTWQQLQKVHFDGIILDLDLPGMPGKDILRSLRKQGNQTPVLVCAGRPDTDPADYDGANDFLLKGNRFSLNLLVDRMKQLLQAQ